jgi:hypothetical protein
VLLVAMRASCVTMLQSWQHAVFAVRPCIRHLGAVLGWVLLHVLAAWLQLCCRDAADQLNQLELWIHKVAMPCQSVTPLDRCCFCFALFVDCRFVAGGNAGDAADQLKQLKMWVHHVGQDAL